MASLLVCCADVRVEVLEGRVSLASSAGVRTLAREPGATSCLGSEPGFLDVPAGSRVRLSFPGSGSLVLGGAAQFEWSHSSSGTWQWQLTELGTAYLELRGGGVDLELPGGWLGRVQSAALWMEVLPSGELLIRHDGGRSLSLTSRSDGQGPRGRLRLEPGEWVRARTEWSVPTTVHRPSRGPRPWQGFRWPWPAGKAPDDRPGPPAVDVLRTREDSSQSGRSIAPGRELTR